MINCLGDSDIYERKDDVMKKNFLDIKIGDTLIVYDEYSHDYNEHLLRIDSIEYDKEYITESNPNGMVCYGTDLEEEEWGDDYITQVTEGNFCRFEATVDRKAREYDGLYSDKFEV